MEYDRMAMEWYAKLPTWNSGNGKLIPWKHTCLTCKTWKPTLRSKLPQKLKVWFKRAICVKLPEKLKVSKLKARISCEPSPETARWQLKNQPNCLKLSWNLTVEKLKVIIPCETLWKTDDKILFETSWFPPQLQGEKWKHFVRDLPENQKWTS